jgi:hypothetical protein
VPWLRRLAAGVSPRRPDFAAGQSMWDLWWIKWHWIRFFSRVLRFSPPNIIPPGLHTHISSFVPTTGPLVAEVQRHGLAPSIWTTPYNNENKWLKFSTYGALSNSESSSIETCPETAKSSPRLHTLSSKIHLNIGLKSGFFSRNFHATFLLPYFFPIRLFLSFLFVPLFPSFVFSTFHYLFLRIFSSPLTMLKFRVFWDVVLRSLIGLARRFRGAYCLQHQGDDGDITHLWNVGPLQWGYTALHPKRLNFILAAVRILNFTFKKLFPFRIT